MLACEENPVATAPGAWRPAEPDNRLVLLVFARSSPDQPDDGSLLGLPLGVLTLAGELLRAGYEARILDQNVTPRVRRELAGLPRPLFVGISCNGGEQIRGGMEVAREVERRWPGVPKIWGGWGPTLIPEVYAHPTSAPLVDALVQGRGDVAVVEIADALAAGRNLAGIRGATWRDADGLVHVEPANPRDVPSSQELLPYHLVDWDAYMTREGIVNYLTSWGCPHRCAFCSIPVAARGFHPTDNDRVVEHLRVLKAKGIRRVVFYDDNFFTSGRRVVALAQRMIDADLRLVWHSNGRLDQISRLTDAELALVRRSGCTYLNIGLETGDQEVSDSIAKDIVVQDVFTIADRCREADIGLTINCIVGLPGESPEAQVRSFEALAEISRRQPKFFVYCYLYVPSPGTPLWHQHVRDGILDPPRTLRDMLRFGRYLSDVSGYYAPPSRRVFRLPQARAQAISWYFNLGHVAPVRPGPLAALARLRAAWCRFRYDRRLFRATWDWRVAYLSSQAAIRARWARKALLRWLPEGLLRPFARRRPERVSRSHFSNLFGPQLP